MGDRSWESNKASETTNSKSVSAGAAPPTPISQPPSPIILIGFMGCGKSCVAQELATLLKCEATDVDSLIVRSAGKSIPEIFTESGEAEFRRIETEQLRAALEETGSARVIATGGGIVTREENRKLLQDAGERGVLVVYLRASSEVLARRIRQQPGQRPLIDGGKILNLEQTRVRVAELLQQRAPLYESVANLVIESDTLTPGAVATQIARELHPQ